MDKKLLAPCGINCAICKGHLREKNTCPGCWFIIPSKTTKSKYRQTCVIKNCEQLAKTKSGFCYECPKFPCRRMKNLNKRYVEKYSYDTFKTLATISDKGISEIINQHKKIYACPGGTICVHDKRCYLNKISTIIFDMNGVIVNDEEIHFIAFKKVMSKFKIDFTEKMYNDLCAGKTDSNGFTNVCYKFNLKCDIKHLVKEKSKEYLLLSENQIKSYMGVIALIKELSKKHNLALVSSSIKKEILNTLNILKIKKYFKVIISAEDVKNGKPDPEPYLLAIKKLKINPENCLVIEDSPAGIESAKRANTLVIAITNTTKKSELKNADYIINKYSQINKIIESS